MYKNSKITTYGFLISSSLHLKFFSVRCSNSSLYKEREFLNPVSSIAPKKTTNITCYLMFVSLSIQN
jgi:hypothetical protein